MAEESTPLQDTALALENEGVKDIVFGSVAGVVGKLVEYPFDTVKVRLQSQPDHLPLRYTGPADCFQQSIRHDGIRGLYRGVSAPIAGAAAETASLFWSYTFAQSLLKSSVVRAPRGEDLHLAWKVTAGAIAGSITSLILTPIELVKCRMQVPLHSNLDPTLRPGSAVGLASTTLSPFSVIADVFRRQGLRGFWHGQLGTFLRETGGTAAWFGSYEACTLFFKNQRVQHSRAVGMNDNLPVSQQMLSGALAGMAYNFLFYPADTVKSKMQTGELTPQDGRKSTFWTVGKELWKTHGMKGLYRGCGITVARSAPSSALIFTIVEQLKATFS